MAERDYGVKFRAEDDGFSSTINRMQSQVTGLTKNLQTRFAGIGSAWRQTLGKLNNPITQLATGAGLFMAVKGIGDLDQHMTRLRIDTGASLSEVMKFKAGMMTTAFATGASVENMSELAESAVAETHDFKFLNEQIGFMTKLMQASGIPAKELGETMGVIYEKTGIAGDGLQDLMKTLYGFGQTKGVQMNLQKVLPQVPQLVATARSYYGKNASIAQIGDVIMTQMMLGRNVNVSRAMLRMLSKSGGPVSQFLAPLGVNLGKDLAKGMPVSQIFKEISDAMTRKGVSPAEKTRMWGNLLGIKAGVGMDKIDEMVQTMSKVDKEQLFRDAGYQAMTFASALERVKTMSTAVINSALGAQIMKWTQAFGDWSQHLSKEKFDGYVKNIKRVAEALVAVAAASAAIKFAAPWIKALGMLFGMTTGKHVPGLGLGQLGGSPANPMYVVVVGGGGLGGAGKGLATKLPGLAGLGGLSTVAAVALPIAGMVTAGVLAHNAYMKQAMSEKAAREDQDRKNAPNYNLEFANADKSIYGGFGSSKVVHEVKIKPTRLTKEMFSITASTGQQVQSGVQ